MKKKKNAFTLIELLAIIVILAIIAVITVPIILNIIENSRKGAASDSAYGYKDSVNKTYIAELQNHNELKLNDTYTVTNGILSGGDFGDEEITSLPVSVSGTIPSSGTLTYENNVLKSGCLVIGDYAVTFDGGSVTDTKKGQCQIVETISSCPGCKFGRPNYDDDEQFDTIGLAPVHTYKDYYSDLGNVFLGQVINPTTGIIEKSYSCGIVKDSDNNDVPFCIESIGLDGYNAEKYAINVNTLKENYPNYSTNCTESPGSYEVSCSNAEVGINALDSGYVSIYDNGSSGFYCFVDSDGLVSSCGQ